MKTVNITNTIKLVAILFISSFALSSCSDDHDDDHGSEEELITTVTYTLTSGTDVVTLKFQDLDGEGGEAGTFTPLNGATLNANTTYTGVLKLENATKSPAEDITLEVKAEGDEHEFFFASSITDLTVEKTDTDVNGNPIGIETSVRTGNAGIGTMTIVLKHEPTKPNNGTSANAGGSTDAEVTFNISVQ
jgi:hypothetical protein